MPRLQNEEADALTNSVFHHFRKENRIEVDLGKLGFLVMDELFAEGENHLTELAELKEQTRKAKALKAEKRVKRLAGDALRDRDPW